MAESINAKYNVFAANTGVRFLEGTQAKLNNLITNGGAQEGAFYLTRDTQRMYVGRSDGTKVYPVPVNEGVTTVASVAALKTVNTANVGDFYYVEAENILCVCSKTNGTGASRTCEWVQLNNDTYATGNSYSLRSTATDTVGITQTLTQNGHTSPLEDTWTLAGSQGVHLTLDTANKKVTISVDTVSYTLGASAGATNEANLSLTPSTGTGQTVKFKGTHIKFGYDSTAGAITATGEEFTGLTVDKVTGYSFQGVIDDTTTGQAATINPTINYGSDGASQATFANDATTLSVYTITETNNAIDTKIRESVHNLDAITFKGTVAAIADVPTTNVEIGDAYKVTSAIPTASSGKTFSPANAALKNGDLIIATSTANPKEDTNGHIPAASITWVVIPSGDEAAYSYQAHNKGFQLLEGSSVIGTYDLANEDGFIAITSTTSGTQSNTVHLNHKAITTNYTTGTAATLSKASHTDTTLTFWAADEVTASSGHIGVETDGRGHVTTTKFKQITVKDTHNYLTTITTAVAVASNVATLTTTYSDHDNQEVRGTMKFASNGNTLTLAASGPDTLNMEIMWGSFES